MGATEAQTSSPGLQVLLLRSAGALGLYTAALTFLFVLTKHYHLVPEFVATNTLPEPLRRRLLIGIAAGGALAFATLLVCSCLPLRFRRAAGRRLETLARLGAPSLVLWLLPVLLNQSVWQKLPLASALSLGLFTLGLERSMRVFLPAIPRPWLETCLALGRRLPVWIQRFWPAFVVAAGASAYALYFSYHTVLEHQRLGTAAFDLGIKDNLMFNAMKGDFFASPVLFGPKGGNYIANHAELVLVLFVPLYALAPRAETLLILQSGLLGLGAITLYLFASTRLPRPSAVLLSLLYLLYAPLHGPNFYDFHWLTVAPPFHFLLFYAVAKRRFWLMLVTLLFLISIREDVPVGLIVLGAVLLVSGARVREGLAIFIVSTAAFVLIKFVLMPWAGQWWFANIYKGLMIPGETGYGSIAKTLASNPVFTLNTLLQAKKLIYWLHLAAPLAFLAYRRWQLALLASPGALFTLFTTDYGPTLRLSFQYNIHWVPYLFGASILGLSWLASEKGRRTAALAAATAGVLVHTWAHGAILNPVGFHGGFAHRPLKITEQERSRYESLRAIAALIPQDASVAGSEEVLPHVSNRRVAYPLRMWSGDADYLLVGRRSVGLGNTRRNLRNAVNSGYGLVKSERGIYLFKRGQKSEGTQKALKDLGA